MGVSTEELVLRTKISHAHWSSPSAANVFNWILRRASIEPLAAKTRGLALVALLILAATMAEFLTGSTAVLEVAHDPLVLLSLIGLYGGGALTIRETALRWGKGWAGMLFLGGAYAVGEEGFGTKTMIDPLHSNIGNQLYSHFVGVNWVPLSYLTLFHAAFSIAVPLIVVDAMFPETQGRPLVGNMGVLLALASYFLVVASISLRVPYQPSLQVYVFLGLYALMWITFARKVGPRFLKPRHEAPDRREIAFVALGVWFMSAFLLIGIVGPKLFPWPVTAALYIPLAASVAWFLKEHVGLKDNDIHKVGFVIGVVAVFVPFDIALELAKDPGVLAYTAAVLALLVAVRGRLKRRAMGVEEFAPVKGSGGFESGTGAPVVEASREPVPRTSWLMPARSG